MPTPLSEALSIFLESIGKKRPPKVPREVRDQIKSQRLDARERLKQKIGVMQPAPYYKNSRCPKCLELALDNPRRIKYRNVWVRKCLRGHSWHEAVEMVRVLPNLRVGGGKL